MVFPILIAAAAVASGPVKAEARATIRILRPAIVSAEVWRTDPRRKERMVTDQQGQQRALRTIEFE